MNRRTLFKTLIMVSLIFATLTGVAAAADGKVTSIDVWITAAVGFAPFLAAAIQGAIVAYKRIVKEGEPWQWDKFLPTLGLGLVSSVFLYLTGVTGVTSEIIAGMIGPYAPLGVIGLFTGAFYYYDQYVRNHGGAHAIAQVAESVKPAATGTSTTTGSPAGTPNQVIGKAKVLGIYHGSAEGQTPVKKDTYDVNIRPTMFAEIEATVAGVMAVKLALDGKVLKKWMPDSSYPTGSRDLTLRTVGEKQALAFQIPENYQETGEHVIAVMTGYFTADRKNTVYDQVEEFALVLTGKKIED